MIVDSHAQEPISAPNRAAIRTNNTDGPTSVSTAKVDVTSVVSGQGNSVSSSKRIEANFNATQGVEYVLVSRMPAEFL